MDVWVCGHVRLNIEDTASTRWDVHDAKVVARTAFKTFWRTWRTVRGQGCVGRLGQSWTVYSTPGTSEDRLHQQGQYKKV